MFTSPPLMLPTRHQTPAGDFSVTRSLEATVAHCKRMVNQRALVAAGAAVVPVPGFDVLADIALMTKLLDQINQEFGLTQAQIELLDSAKRAATYKSISWVGNQLIGKVVTQALVLALFKAVGVRMGAKQVTKYLPIAGQALSATLAFTAMRHLCNKHIADCAKVRSSLLLENKP